MLPEAPTTDNLTHVLSNQMLHFGPSSAIGVPELRRLGVLGHTAQGFEQGIGLRAGIVEAWAYNVLKFLA